MTTVIIVIHLMVVVAMIGLVLLQRSEGGALGIGGGGGGSGAFMTGRGAANMLTRSTAGLAIAFFATSILLTLISRWESGPVDIFESLPDQPAAVTEEAPAPPITSGGGSAEEMLRQLGGPTETPSTDDAAGDAAEGADAPLAPPTGE